MGNGKGVARAKESEDRRSIKFKRFDVSIPSWRRLRVRDSVTEGPRPLTLYLLLAHSCESESGSENNEFWETGWKKMQITDLMVLDAKS